jgi:tetraacyldisaccharide 4'-kinase
VALAPAEWAYHAATEVRNRAYDRHWLDAAQAAIPVISVGNLAVGGSGKTPFTAWLAGRVAQWGRAPAVVLRGYGEDEVLLHRELNAKVPVFTGRKRAGAVRDAAAAGCDVAILDDGFQHRALHRDLNMVLVAADGWTSRRRLLPRGPWRESSRALGRADVVVVVRKAVQDSRAVSAELRGAAPSALLVECAITPGALVPLHGEHQTAEPLLQGSSVLGVASLADPRPFAAHLHEIAASAELVAFPDHYPFRPVDADQLRSRAAGRPIIMTRKEAVKLRPLLPSSERAFVLHQRVEITSGAKQFDAAVRRVFGGSLS